MAFMLLLLQPFSWLNPVSSRYWMLQGLIFCLFLALFYVNACLWVPRLLFKNRAVAFAAAALGSGLATWYGAIWLSAAFGLGEVMTRTLYPGQDPVSSVDAGLASGGLVFSGMAFLVLLTSTCAAYSHRQYLESYVRQALETQQANAELAFLKARVNPHLFFKTLHHIYSLTLADGPRARETVYTLARLMRYLLHETASGTTYLSKETDLLQDYIDLFRASLRDKVLVSFEKPIVLNDLEMAPMLLLPFVENAFSQTDRGSQSGKVCIAISQEAGMVDFTVRHTLSPKALTNRQEGNGLDLASIRHRLELLYPGRFALNITEKNKDQEFLVHLRLELGIKA